MPLRRIALPLALAAALFAGGSGGPGLAAYAGAVEVAQAATADSPEASADPREFVRSLADNAINTVARADISDSERQSRFRALFTANVDLNSVGRFILTRYWNKATPDQRQEFLALFEDVAVYTWATKFKDYSGEAMTVLGVRQEADEVFVDSTLEQRQGPPVMVIWRLNKTPAGYRVVDLTVEGISMVLTYRSEYTSVIQRSGGDVGALLTAMRAKVADLKAGKTG